MSNEFKLFRQPSGLSPLAENLDALPGGVEYYQNLQRVMEKDYCAVHVLNEWGQSRSGSAVFQDYSDEVHCRPFDLPLNPLFTLGLDPGIRHCGGVLIYRPPTGGVWVPDEIDKTDTDIEGFADAIKQCVAKYRGAAIQNVAIDPAATHRGLDARNAIDLLRRFGIHAIPARTNDPRIRILAVGQALRSMERDGSPTFRLHPRCRVLRRGFLGDFQFRKSQAGVVGDVILKNEVSHCMDGLSYGVMSLGDLRQKQVVWPTDSDGNLVPVHHRSDWPI